MGVVVVGAGPTGLMLAGDLAAAGIPVTLLEKRAEESNLTRAFGVHARTLELLDVRGCADELVEQGYRVDRFRPQMGGRGDLQLGFEHPDSRFPFVLIVAQARTETLLRRRAERLGVEIVHGARVTGVLQDADRVTVEVEGGPNRTADHVVGCDGAHSVVRAALGVGFSGRTYATTLLLADVRTRTPQQEGINGLMGRDGTVLMPAFGDGWHRAVIWDRTRQHVPIDRPLGIDEVRESVDRIAGREVGIAEMRWSTRFLTERRQADRYRVGRVFLAGDAAHVHSPMGSLGMNTGIQDAANLAWKLVAAYRGWAPDWLLDTYQTERHRVGRTALGTSDLLLRSALAPPFVHRIRPHAARVLLAIPPVTRLMRETIAGMNIAYPTPPGLAAVRGAGRRVADRDLVVDGCPQRLYQLLSPDRFLLLDLTPSGCVARELDGCLPGRVDVVRAGEACRAGTSVPGVLLIRPDGYLAWSGRNPSVDRVREAVGGWCGAPGTGRIGAVPAASSSSDRRVIVE